MSLVLGDVLSHLQSIEVSAEKTLIRLALAAIEYAIELHGDQLWGLGHDVDNSSTMKAARSAHSKLTKGLRDENIDKASQRQALMCNKQKRLRRY